VRHKGLIACLLVTLFAAGCGSRLPNDVLNAIDARGVAGAGAQAAAEGAGNSSTSPVGVSSIGRGPSAAGGPISAGGASASGGASSTGGVARSSSCDHASSNAPGVTDSEIKVASIVTDSGPLPGATEGSFRGAASYFAMVNAAGGVCGRKITLLKGDDGLDPAKARSEFLRLEPQILAFVGAFAVADSGYINLIKSTGVPYVSLVIDPAGRGPRNVMPRIAEGLVNTGPFVWWKQQHPKVRNAAMLYASVGGVEANIPGFKAAIKKAGFDLKYAAGTQVASPDYTPEVRQAQDNHIEFLYLFAFEVNMHVRFVRNMRQQNYSPPIKGANIAFNTRFSQLLGKDGDGWENHQTHLLFLDPKERNRSPGLARFIDWNERVFPGAQLDLFPVSGWANASLFVDALQRIKGTIRRQSLIDALYSVPSFSGAGIQAEVDPRTGIGPPCWNMAVHRGGGWVREYPTDRLFACNIGELYRFK
jgi:ABC-type branched-subunit amino acid transport system substrate-binding protein